MRDSAKFLELRFERLAAEHPKLKTLRELYRLRSSFPQLRAALEAGDVRKSLAEGMVPNLLLIQKINAESYAVSVIEFAEQVLKIAPDSALRRVLEEIEKEPRMALEIYRRTVAGEATAEIDAELLRFVLEAPIVGALKSLAAELPASAPARSSCPVCGTKFTLAAYSQRRRYLLCKSCEARVHIDILKCPSCGNEDSRKLGFLKLEDEPQLQIDYCSACGSYVKAVDEDAIGSINHAALLDLATLDLDALAKDRGFGKKKK